MSFSSCFCSSFAANSSGVSCTADEVADRAPGVKMPPPGVYICILSVVFAVLLPGRDELGRLADFDPPAAAVWSPGVPAKDDGDPDLGVPLGDPPRLLLGDREPRRRGVGGYSSNFLSL